MEGRGLFAAIGQEGEYLGDFDKAAGPWPVSTEGIARLTRVRTAMREKQRNCSLYIALLVHEMYIQRFEAVDLYGGLEIWQFIELSFLPSPIKSFSPVNSQSFHISQRCAIVPAGMVELVREGCGFKLLG